VLTDESGQAFLVIGVERAKGRELVASLEQALVTLRDAIAESEART